MGSRVLLTLNPHEGLSGWLRTLLGKLNNNAPFQVDFLKSGRPIFSGNRGAKRRLIRRASRAAICAVQALVHVPDVTNPVALEHCKFHSCFGCAFDAIEGLF
jgi:hypothetical protein